MRLVAILALLWCGWWFAAAEGARTGLRSWLDQRRAEGWVAEAGAIDLTGFPVRFEARLGAVDLADPASGLAWSAPGIRLVAPAWNPADVTAYLPPEQVFTLHRARYTVTASASSARLTLLPVPALPLTRAAADLDAISIAAGAGWTARVHAARFELTRAQRGGARYDIVFRADALDPPAPLLAQVDPAGRLPATVALLTLEATAGFDAPWDREAILGRRPQPASLALRRFAARWGGFEIEAEGEIAFDSDGRPDGSLTIHAVDWRGMLQLGQESGLIAPEFADRLSTGLALLAAAAGDPRRLTLTLTFRGGEAALGPIPLGPAPRLRLPW